MAVLPGKKPTERFLKAPAVAFQQALTSYKLSQNQARLIVFLKMNLNYGDVGRRDASYSAGLGKGGGPKRRQLLFRLCPKVLDAVVIDAFRDPLVLQRP